MKTIHCVTIHPFDPWGSKIGGIESFIRAMLRHAPAHVHHSLIGVSENPRLRPLHQWQSLQYQQTPLSFLPIMEDAAPNRRGRVPLFLRFPFFLRRVRIHFTADLLLFHRVEPAFATERAPAPSVLFIHGNPREITGPHSEVKWKHIPWLYHRIEKRAIRQCTHVHVVSQSGVRHLQSRYPHRAAHILFQPTGFDADVFHCGEEPDASDRSTPRVLFAGRLEAQKNPLSALQAFFHLRKSIKQAQLWIAGEGSFLPSLQSACAASPFGNDVTFLGRLDSASLAQTMRNCHVFLITSRFEGMPIAALEALACGLPVVSTDVGEARLLIQEGVNGSVISGDDPLVIAQALGHWLYTADPSLKSRIAQSIESYRFSRVMDNLYQKISAYPQPS